MAKKRVKPPIRAVVCRMGQPAIVAEIDPSYVSISALVGGMVECAFVASGVELVANEEGSYRFPFNRYVPALAPPVPAGVSFAVALDAALVPPGSGQVGVHRVHGDFFLCRTGLRGLTAERAERICELLNAAFPPVES